MCAFYRHHGKRLVDIVTSLVGLALLSPIIAIVAVLVRWKLGVPILFRQERAGLNGSCFTIVKFRSMTDARDERGELLPDEYRLTTFGRTIRRWRLDEVLQLWNVARGEMSCVGPRPAVSSLLATYDEFQRRRLERRPGITGWAQVNGNVQLTWDERILLDVWYVDHLSSWLDLRIILATFKVLVCGERPNKSALKTAKEHAKCVSRCG